MTIRYVRSSSSYTDGLSWAGAHTTLAAAYTASVGGDTIYVSQAHSEANAVTGNTFTFSSSTNPLNIYCANDGAQPPTALATGAVVASNAGFSITGNVYIYGITYKTTAATASGWIAVGGGTAGRAVFDNCTFWASATSGSAQIYVGSVSSAGTHSRSICNDCSFKFGVVGNTIWIGRGCEFYGCVMPDPTGNNIPTILFPRDTTSGAASGTTIYFTGCDFSAAGSGKTLFGTPQVMDNFYLVDCKLNAAVTLNSTILDAGSGEIYIKNSGSANNNYQYAVRKYAGNIDIDIDQYITLASDGGSTDGDTGYSWKMTGNANTSFSHPLVSEWIYMRYGTTGEAKTARIETLHDGTAALTNAEIWMEFAALTDASSPLATFDRSDRRGLLASAADQDTGISSPLWTCPAAVHTWRSQRLISASFTAQKKGYVMARVCLAANKTVYVNPNILIA